MAAGRRVDANTTPAIATPMMTIKREEYVDLVRLVANLNQLTHLANEGRNVTIANGLLERVLAETCRLRQGLLGVEVSSMITNGGKGKRFRSTLECDLLTAVETGRDQYQAWVKLSQRPLEVFSRGQAAEGLVQGLGRYSAKAISRTDGRLAGFTNQQVQRGRRQHSMSWSRNVMAGLRHWQLLISHARSP